MSLVVGASFFVWKSQHKRRKRIIIIIIIYHHPHSSSKPWAALLLRLSAHTVAKPPRPSRLTITINTAGDVSLPFIAANVLAYGSDNLAMAYHDVILPAAANASKFVCGVPILCKNQEKACLFLLNSSKPRVLLNIDQTGRGETHVTRVVGVILNGIIVIITPLLTLSMDQMAKFTARNQHYGIIEVHHMYVLMYVCMFDLR